MQKNNRVSSKKVPDDSRNPLSEDSSSTGLRRYENGWRQKRFWLFCVSFILCQTVDYFYKNTAALNQNLLFGLVGTNLEAIIFSTIAILILIFLIKDQKRIAAPLVPVLAGAISNLTDRLIYGGTLDYWHLQPIPTFNLADVLIVGGIIVYLYYQTTNRHST